MTTPRYGEALQWADELHRAQRVGVGKRRPEPRLDRRTLRGGGGRHRARLHRQLS